MCRNISRCNIVSEILVANEVAIHFDVLGVLMKNQVLDNMKHCLTVTMKSHNLAHHAILLRKKARRWLHVHNFLKVLG